MKRIGDTIKDQVKQMTAGEDNDLCPDCGQPRLVCMRENKCREKRLKKHKEEHPEYYLRQFGVPRKFLSRSLENFEGNNKKEKELVAFCQKYNGRDSVVLIGKCGCGKTHLAVGILRMLIQKDEISSWAIFITAPEILLHLKKCFDTPNMSESDVVDHYSKTGFLILDDLGAEKATEWAITSLYLIIDRRNRENRPTIYTTNLSLVEIEKQLGARIASRLADCKIASITMPDYRMKRK